jgi:hypothetical protein
MQVRMAGKLYMFFIINTIKIHSMATNTNPQHNEGPVATAIEEQTAKLPSDLFLWTGIAFMALSLGMQLAGKQKASNFVGHWPANILLLGLYNKLVKLEGHD